MATSSSRGNREVPKVEQIGKGPPECQLGLSAGRAGGRREVRSTGWGQGLLSLIRSPKLDGAAFSESDGATHARHVT